MCPGPKQYPLVGRIHDLPRFSLWLKFQEWAGEFGSIYQTRMGSQTFVIVSSEEMAYELLLARLHLPGPAPDPSLAVAQVGPQLLGAHGPPRHLAPPAQVGARRLLAMLVLHPARFVAYSREFCGRVMSRLAWDESDDTTLGRANGDHADTMLHCMSVSGPITNTLSPLWHLPLPLTPWKQYEIMREQTLAQWWIGKVPDQKLPITPPFYRASN